MNRCECEHESHLDAADYPRQAKPPVPHKYGAIFGETFPVKTLWGTFHVCRDCKDKCMASVAEVSNA